MKKVKVEQVDLLLTASVPEVLTEQVINNYPIW